MGLTRSERIEIEGGVRGHGGRALMRDTRNDVLHVPLSSTFKEGQRASRPDKLIHKNRSSGLGDEVSAYTQYLPRSARLTNANRRLA